MLLRGDKQHDIAAWFGCNAGRVAEVATGAKHAAVLVARPEVLPPRVSMHDVHARLVAIEILLAQLLERLDR
jgi:cytochrome c551/c552